MEIKHLKITNKEKEIVLEKVQSENDVINDQLKNLQTKLENELEESISMDKELAAYVSRTIDWEECGVKFINVSDLKCHKKKVHRVKAQIIAL